MNREVCGKDGLLNNRDSLGVLRGGEGLQYGVPFHVDEDQGLVKVVFL